MAGATNEIAGCDCQAGPVNLRAIRVQEPRMALFQKPAQTPAEIARGRPLDISPA